MAQSATIKLCNRCRKNPSVDQEKNGYCQKCRDYMTQYQQQLMQEKYSKIRKYRTLKMREYRNTKRTGDIRPYHKNKIKMEA